MTPFELTVLGSNSALPSYERFSTSHFLNINYNFFLIDAAEGVQIQLKRFKIKAFKINNIFISHLHGDHFFGLFGLLSTYNLLDRKTPVNIYAPEELKKILDSVFNAEVTENLKFNINFFPLPENFSKIFENKDVEVFSFPLKHRIKTNGFLFREKQRPPNVIKEKITELGLTVEQIKALKRGEDIYADNRLYKNSELTIPPPKPRSYAFVSDTAFCPTLTDFFQNVDLLYHEATFLDMDKENALLTWHSTAVQAAKIAKLANAKKLLIGHFSSRYGTVEPFAKEAKKIFPNTILAYDGLKINI